MGRHARAAGREAARRGLPRPPHGGLCLQVRDARSPPRGPDPRLEWLRHFGFRIHAPEAEHKAVMARYTAVRRERIPPTAAYWRDEALPELQAIYREMDEVDADASLPLGSPGGRLGAGMDPRRAHLADPLLRHHRAVPGAGRPGRQIRGARRERHRNRGAWPGRGLVDEIRLAEEGLERLTNAAAAAPAVAGRLRTGGPATIAQIEGLDGSGPFVAELRAFLAVHGHLGQAGEDRQRVVVWRMLGRSSPTSASGSSAAGPRRRALGRPGSGVGGDRQPNAGFAHSPGGPRRSSRACWRPREIGPLTEGHNYWIDRMCSDRLRRASGARRRLVRDGALDVADDIMFLKRERGPDFWPAPLDARPLVAERRREHARRQSLQRRGWWASPGTSPAEAGSLRRRAISRPIRWHAAWGTGASAGVVRGRACIVLLHRGLRSGHARRHHRRPGLKPGWVRSSRSPGGFVTVTGGVLSHAAVVAPRVRLARPSSGRATRDQARIPDGGSWRSTEPLASSVRVTDPDPVGRSRKQRRRRPCAPPPDRVDAGHCLRRDPRAAQLDDAGRRAAERDDDLRRGAE